ncbi:MAG: response regulator transcription factor, partial [Verrucomicrobiota bacterium]
MSETRILIAEDEDNIRTGLIDTLESEGYEVTAAVNGADALKQYAGGDFQLIMLDVMMPEKSGYDVCREIRTDNKDVPIIMLTAKGEEIDKVVGLELGADDYITKPFGVHELLARIAAILRRSNRSGAINGNGGSLPDTLDFGKAKIDRKKYQGKLGKSSFDLTARELKLIEVFYAHRDEVLSRDDLLNAVWGIDYFGTTRTLDQHIAQLR